MTTTLKNIDYTPLFTAFRSEALPVNPLPFLYALANSVRNNGSGWMQTNEAKAMLFVLVQMTYGERCTLDGKKEFKRLNGVFSGLG